MTGLTEDQRNQARCLDAARRDPALYESFWGYYAEDGSTVHTSAMQRRAKACCAKCPVKAECLEAGLHETFGIWGGEGRRGRERILAVRAGKPIKRDARRRRNPKP